jgi:glycosyltransferase involved in cell wall biosynthesis
MMNSCTIVIPVYNEFKSLEILLEKINEISNQNVTFLIVDNGSTDPKVQEVLTRTKRSGWVQVRTEINQGGGGGLVCGISKCDTDFVGWMPGNLKVDPQEVVRVLTHIDFARIDVIKAKRLGRSTSARLKTWIIGVIQSVILQSNMFDAGGTPTICRRSLLVDLNKVPKDYVFESYILYQARQAKSRIVRPGVNYGLRKFGVSHWQRGFSSELSLTIKILKASLKWK